MYLPTRRSGAYLPPRARRALSILQVLVLVLSLIVPALPVAAMPAVQEETPVVELPPAESVVPEEEVPVVEIPPVEDLVLPEAPAVEPPMIEAPVVLAAPTAIDDCEIDTDGPNDPSGDGQKDMTKICIDPLSNNPLLISWNWDDTSSTNSADACALFDTDGDYLANYALCNQFKDTTQTPGYPKLYSCTDAKPLNCSGRTEITKSAGTTCTLAITGSDPFNSSWTNGPGDYYPDDMTSTCSITAADVGGGKLLDVCSMTSGSTNSVASDCVVRSLNNGNLEIKKDVVPNDASAWTFTVSGPTSFTSSGILDGGSTGNHVVLGGAYGIVETADSNYDTTWSCQKSNESGSTTTSGNGTTVSNLQIANADVVICTFTNTRKYGSLDVVKSLVPSSDTSQWTLSYTGPASDSGDKGHGGHLGPDAVPTGTYTVAELPAQGIDGTLYGSTGSCTGSSAVGGNGTLSADGRSITGVVVNKNDVVVCTFTNTLLTGTLVVTKVLPNDNSGTLTCPDFSFTVNGGAATPFEADCSNSQTVLVGTYDIEEDNLPIAGYDTAYNNCADVVVSAGETETCTITNDDQPNPAIDVEKYVSADGGVTWDDADTAPGLYLLSAVSPQFKFVVTNSGDAALTNISLTDSDFDLSSCTVPATLAKAASFKCTITAAWAAGQHTDTATAAGAYGTTTYEDTDDANYYGATPAITVDKTASPTAVPETGGDVVFTFKVTNSGNVPVTIASLNDSVFGALAGDADCQVGTVLASNASCEFATTQWLAGSSCGMPHANTFTAYASFSGTDVWDDDDATVGFTDVAPVIQVTKTASPTHVPETGGDVTFTFLVENTGQQDVMLSALTDTVFGDLDGKGTCAVPQTILIGGSYTCEYTVNLASDSLTAHTNTVTATASDSCGTQATDTDDETVTFDDVSPVIRVTKTADPLHVPETGGNVKFTFLVENIGPEDVTLTSLVDDKFGDLDGKGTCDVPQTILIGGSYTCEYTVNLASDSLTPHTNVVTATAVDDDYTAASDTDDATVTFDDVAPDITITKTADPTHVPETGGDVTFTFLVENIGPEDVTLTSLTDTVFGDLNGQGDCITGGLISVGGSYSCSITKFLASDSLTPHTNVVTAVGTDDDSTADTATDDETVTFDDVLPTVDLTKAADPLTRPEPGGVFVFTLTIHNTSPEMVWITELLDDNELSSECQQLVGNSIVAGGTASCTYSVSYTEAGSYDNTAAVTVEDNDHNPASDSDDETVTVTDVLPTVDLTKSATPQSLPEPGGVNTFTLNVHNTSPEAVTITALTDTNALSAECLALVGTTLSAGASTSCTYAVTHTEAGTYPNTASVTVADNEGNPASDSDNETVTVTDVMPTVTLTKSATPSTWPEPGGAFEFTVEITNTSVEEVTIVHFTDTQTDECDYLVGTVLAIGGSVSCNYSVSHTEAGLYPNTASVIVQDNEENPASASDEEIVVVIDVQPTITVLKTAVPTSVNEPGGDVVFTFRVTNTSVEPVTIATLTDTDFTLTGDADCQVGTVLPVDGWCEFSQTFPILGDASDPDHVNTFTAEATDNDGNTATASDDETVGFDDVLPTITVLKTAAVASVLEPGAPVLFTFRVTNTSVEPVTIASLSDTDFTLTGDADCQVGTVLPVGGSCEFTQTEFIAGDASDPDHENTFTATATDNENNTATASDNETVSFDDVLPTVDLTKSALPTTLPEPGGDFVFTLEIENTSVEPVTITALTDDNALSQECLDLIGDVIPVGGSVSCSYTVSHTDAGSYDNTATVTVEDNEGNSASDSDDETVTVTDVLPTVDLTKSVTPASLVEPGGVFQFTLTIKNTSVEAVTITALTDDNPLPTACTDLIGDVLTPDQTVTCTYDVTHTYAGSYPNTASVTVKDNENNSASDTDSKTVTVAPRAGALLPTQKTCQDYVSGNWYPMYSEFSYQVGKGNAISAVSPGVIFYYNTITAPSASFSVTAVETNTLGWKAMLWQDIGQALLYTSSCDKASGYTVTQAPTTSATSPYRITFNVTGATPGATYYIGIKYSPQNLVGQKVQKSGGKYPTNNYSWATSMGGVTSGAVSIPVAPKK